MKVSTTVFAVVVASAVAFAACGGSPAASPTSTSAAVPAVEAAAAAGGVTQSGYGPGDGTGYGHGNGPADGTGNGPGASLCGVACTGTADPGPSDLAALLALALQEEYKAEALYRSVLAHLGDVPPFALIAAAEAPHASALQLLFSRRGWTAPASAWSPELFPQFATLADACAAAVTAEQEDAAFYTPYLARTDLPKDVVTVLTNLQAASLEHHLPAFERCR